MTKRWVPRAAVIVVSVAIYGAILWLLLVDVWEGRPSIDELAVAVQDFGPKDWIVLLYAVVMMGVALLAVSMVRPGSWLERKWVDRIRRKGQP